MNRDSRKEMIRNSPFLGFAIASLASGTAWADRVSPNAAGSGAPSIVEPVGDRTRALGCLATAIAYESAGQPVSGQQAVAEVILNRVRNPGFPKTICGVVFAGSERRTGCQFSFTCDGSLARHMPEPAMAIARAIAAAALDGRNPVRVAGATHYHADYVSPYWAPSLIRIAKIGAHIFYRGAGLPDGSMRTASFAQLGEPVIAELDPGISSASRISHTEAATQPGASKIFAPWGLAPAR